MASHTSLPVSIGVFLFDQRLRLMSLGSRGFRSNRPERNNLSTVRLQRSLLNGIRPLQDPTKQPTLLSRAESAGTRETVVTKGTVEGLGGDMATMVQTTQSNPDLHVRFIPTATIAYRHDPWILR